MSLCLWISGLSGQTIWVEFLGRTKRSAVPAIARHLPERRCAWSGLPLYMYMYRYVSQEICPQEKLQPFKQGLNSQHGTVVGKRVEGVDDKACRQQVALEKTQAVRTADTGTWQGDGECG